MLTLFELSLPFTKILHWTRSLGMLFLQVCPRANGFKKTQNISGTNDQVVLGPDSYPIGVYIKPLETIFRRFAFELFRIRSLVKCKGGMSHLPHALL